jgi:hypothetical protein
VHAVHSPRKLCAQYASFALACWYRYWIEQAPGPVIQAAGDLSRLCRGLAGSQREGCIAGAAKDVFDTPPAQMGYCAKLGTADALACMRGVANQEYAGEPRREAALVGRCSRLPAGARAGCAAWLGQTFNVVENGRFSCARVGLALRSACAAGARRWLGPLETFS